MQHSSLSVAARGREGRPQGHEHPTLSLMAWTKGHAVCGIIAITTPLPPPTPPPHAEIKTHRIFSVIEILTLQVSFSCFSNGRSIQTSLWLGHCWRTCATIVSVVQLGMLSLPGAPAPGRPSGAHAVSLHSRLTHLFTCVFVYRRAKGCTMSPYSWSFRKFYPCQGCVLSK